MSKRMNCLPVMAIALGAALTGTAIAAKDRRLQQGMGGMSAWAVCLAAA